MAAQGGLRANLQRINNFRLVSDLGSGNFGVAKLMLDLTTNALVAVKFIERGEKIDRNVEREIINHCTLNHPNIVGFKEVFLTPTHLAIVMEYAAGGELFERIVKAGRFSEDEARYFFQQLISGVDYCHRSGVCHRDLKLENTLLDNNPAPRLKICDFGYSKSALDSQPKSTVGTPAYIAPEVLQRKEYNGQTADVWSTGVTLFVMLVGAYPFEDPADPRNFRKTIQRIMAVSYAVPAGLNISPECKDLISRIFVGSPQQRITMAQIRQHPWFIKNLPVELADPDNYVRNPDPHQNMEEIRSMIHAARQQDGVTDGSQDDFDHPDSMGDELGGPVPQPLRRPSQSHQPQPIPRPPQQLLQQQQQQQMLLQQQRQQQQAVLVANQQQQQGGGRPHVGMQQQQPGAAWQPVQHQLHQHQQQPYQLPQPQQPHQSYQLQGQQQQQPFQQQQQPYQPNQQQLLNHQQQQGRPAPVIMQLPQWPSPVLRQG